MSDHCADHAGLCQTLGEITEGMSGLSGTMERLLIQSNEHYDTEKELREANNEQNISLALINKSLEELVKHQEKQEKTDKEKRKDKIRMAWQVAMTFISPFAVLIIGFIALKMGLK